MLPQPTTYLQRPRMPPSPSGLPSVRIFSISTPSAPSAHPVLHLGRAAEAMGDLDRALGAYERALIINSQSWAALTMAAHVCRCKEDYGRVSPVTNLLSLPLSRSASFSHSPYPGSCPGSCVCAYHTLPSRPRAPLLLCVAAQPWRQAASETTTSKDCRCLGMWIRVYVCISLPPNSLHF